MTPSTNNINQMNTKIQSTQTRLFGMDSGLGLEHKKESS